MGKSILDVMHETAKGLTDAGVMDIQTLRELGMLQEFDRADYLTTTEDIKLYLEAWGGEEGDNLELLQLMLEDSVKAVIKLRQEQGEHDGRTI